LDIFFSIEPRNVLTNRLWPMSRQRGFTPIHDRFVGFALEDWDQEHSARG
jgi:hypothetical protein